MTKISFSKMQGLGNDYIYINCLESDLTNPNELALKLSDRHFGIGGDGIVLIQQSERADFKMRMFNADGSEAQMCGNAARCVGKYLYDRGHTKRESIDLETLAGIKNLRLQIEVGKATAVTVNLGAPILAPSRIPVNLPLERVVAETVELAGQEFKITCVSMGNPHTVIFVPEINDQLVLGIGPLIEKHPLFPERTNVEFVKVENQQQLTMRVWERGSGETLACGTGAGAVCVAANLNGLSARAVTINLLGGKLELNWAEDNYVYKTGPAEFVFEGEIEV